MMMIIACAFVLVATSRSISDGIYRRNHNFMAHRTCVKNSGYLVFLAAA
jgi:hypothetical protein